VLGSYAAILSPGISLPPRVSARQRTAPRRDRRA